MTGQQPEQRQEVLGEQSRSCVEPERNWYAAYTHSRHEKTVSAHLEEREIEHLLPLYKSVRQWRNGKHSVELPLFPGYIFVRISTLDKLRTLQTPGLAYLVGNHGRPQALPEREIESIREAIRVGIATTPWPYLTAGSRVQITDGPLQGLTGILVRRLGKLRVVISLDLIMRSVAVEVNAGDITPC